MVEAFARSPEILCSIWQHPLVLLRTLSAQSVCPDSSRDATVSPTLPFSVEDLPRQLVILTRLLVLLPFVSTSGLTPFRTSFFVTFKRIQTCVAGLCFGCAFKRLEFRFTTLVRSRKHISCEASTMLRSNVCSPMPLLLGNSRSYTKLPSLP